MFCCHYASALLATDSKYKNGADNRNTSPPSICRMHRLRPRCNFEEAGPPGDSSLEHCPGDRKQPTNLELPGLPRPTADILEICQILRQIWSGVKESSMNGQERICR